MMRTFRVSTAFLCIFLAGAASAATTAPPFPRLATVNFSSPQNYDDPTYQANLAKYNIALLSYWPGWSNGRSMSMQNVVTNIKNKNSQTSVFLYINNNEINLTNPTWAPLANQVNSMKWWLYPSGTSGSPVSSAYAGAVEVNTTLFTAPNSNGDRWVEWYAKWAATNLYVPNPAIDGFFTDNVFNKPRVNGDWNLDGSSDSDGDSTVAQWYRQGYNRHFAVLNQVMPGKLQLGNVTDWGASGASLSSYTGILNGGLLESMIGYSYSPETWGGWTEMMREYRVVMAAMGSPQLLIFGQVGVLGDYQGFRYGFASCLMDNGYYEYSLAANAYSGTFWFDEFNVKLGNATSGPALTAWQKGVYRRDFDNGIALVNPKGNGQQTVQLETNFTRVSGSQDPKTNNGQVTKSVTLNDSDGIILLRIGTVAPAAAPQPPGSVSVQ